MNIYKVITEKGSYRIEAEYLHVGESIRLYNDASTIVASVPLNTIILDESSVKELSPDYIEEKSKSMQSILSTMKELTEFLRQIENKQNG